MPCHDGGDEPCTDALALRQLGVQDLDRELLVVAVRGQVDGGHSAHAEDAVEAVLATQDAPEARASDGQHLVLGHGAPSVPHRLPGAEATASSAMVVHAVEQEVEPGRVSPRALLAPPVVSRARAVLTSFQQE